MNVILDVINYNNIQVSWANVNCSYTDVRITITNVGGTTYFDRVFEFGNIDYYTFIDLPVGTFEVVVDAGSGSTESTFSGCDTGSNQATTEATPNFCIPAGATDMSFSRLAEFYGLASTNITLSGPNNPSTGETIFGKSDLPTSGDPSKLRPNAVSELRGTCGGIIPFAPNEAYTRCVSSGQRDLYIQELNVELYPGSSSFVHSQSYDCLDTELTKYFETTPSTLYFKVRCNVVTGASSPGNLIIQVIRMDNNALIYDVNTNLTQYQDYYVDFSVVLNNQYPYRIRAEFIGSAC